LYGSSLLLAAAAIAIAIAIAVADIFVTSLAQLAMRHTWASWTTEAALSVLTLSSALSARVGACY